MTLIRLLPLAGATAISLSRMAELKTKRETVAGKIHRSVTLRLFFLAGAALFAGALVEYFLRGAIFSWPWFVTGILLGILSFWIRRRAIDALGKFWSMQIEIRENHEFVRSGPFRWMRHPVYFSMILELVAVGLVLHAPVTMAVIIPFLFVPVLLARIRLEEEAMVGKFGGAYLDYRKTTPSIFPFTKF